MLGFFVLFCLFFNHKESLWVIPCYVFKSLERQTPFQLLGLLLRGKTHTWRKDYAAHAFNKAIKDTQIETNKPKKYSIKPTH